MHVYCVLSFSAAQWSCNRVWLFRQLIISFCVCSLFSVPLCSVPLKNSFYGTLRSTVNNISTPEPAVRHSLSGLWPLTKAHFYGNLQLAWGKGLGRTVGIVVVLYRNHKTKKREKNEKKILFERLGKIHRTTTVKGHTQEHRGKNKTTRWTLPAAEEDQGQVLPQQRLP